MPSPLSLGDVLQERFSGGFGVLSGVDRAADDDVVGTEADSLFGRRDAGLVAGFGAGQPDAWRDDEEIRPGFGADGGGFLARGDDAVEAREFRHAGAADHEACRRYVGNALFFKVGLIEARQHRDGEQLQVRGATAFDGGFQRLGVVAVDGDEIDAQPGRRRDRALDGIADVEEFQIEENAFSFALQFLSKIETARKQQFQADLVEADGIAEAINKSARLIVRRQIEGDDELVSGGGVNHRGIVPLAVQHAGGACEPLNDSLELLGLLFVFQVAVLVEGIGGAG
ncbi:protein of unknown function [Hyphomicrobium sp. MC1]|nr:protein of unknown function [Hyphomicrobium sp. MC1]